MTVKNESDFIINVYLDPERSWIPRIDKKEERTFSELTQIRFDLCNSDRVPVRKGRVIYLTSDQTITIGEDGEYLETFCLVDPAYPEQIKN